jgi:phosphomethylpyrimidine synthase
MSNDAPYYMLGPLPTDIGAGYDHITAAIGAASSARYGADLICYITPAEHLALPNEADVREGVRSTRLAAHIGDVSKYPERRGREMAMAKARRERKWDEQFDLALFSDAARKIRDSRTPEKDDTCTMCGSFCALDNGNQHFVEELKNGVKG